MELHGALNNQNNLKRKEQRWEINSFQFKNLLQSYRKKNEYGTGIKIDI